MGQTMEIGTRFFSIRYPESHGFRTVLVLDPLKIGSDGIQGIFPGNPFKITGPSLAKAFQWIFQPVTVVDEVKLRSPAGTRIDQTGNCPINLHSLTVTDMDFHRATGCAHITDPIFDYCVLKHNQPLFLCIPCIKRVSIFTELTEMTFLS